MRVKSLFYKKMKCNLCESNFTLRKEKGKKKYICSNYHNTGKCKRISIEEEMLVGLVNRRYNRELSEEEIREVVVEIIIKSELYFDIILTEGVPISFHERGIVF